MKGLENNYTCMICLILRPQLQNSTGNNSYGEIVGPGFFPHNHHNQMSHI